MRKPGSGHGLYMILILLKPLTPEDTLTETRPRSNHVQSVNVP